MSKLGALQFTNHTGGRHTATVIFFHGSGGTGDNMKEWVTLMTKYFTFPHIKVLYPTAPLQPYTPSGGMLSNVWFDRSDISISAPEILDSLSNIEIEVRNLIKMENQAGIPSNRIIIGGFSMGGALSLHAGYRWDTNVAGVFAFSSFLNDNSIVYEELKKSHARVPPLLQLHGDNDALVKLSWAKTTYEMLKTNGVKGDFHLLLRLGHSINSKGINIIKNWIDQLLPL